MELWRRHSDNPDFRVIVEAAFPEIVGQYAAAGALASAQWYDEMAPDLDYRAVPVVDLPAERFTKTIGWSLYAPGQASPLDRMAGAAQRMIFDASRQTVLANLDTEYGSAPEVGTRWARYASATACGFCRMLATRKAVYRSAESATRVVGRSTELTVSDRRIRAAGLATTDELLARRDVYERNTRWGSKGEKKIKALRGNTSRGSRYHDNCRCVAVPVRPGQTYEPPDDVARWEDEYLAARDAGARTPGEIAAAMDKAPGGRRVSTTGNVPPGKPPKPPVPAAGGEDEPEGWSGHTKGYVHPHRASIWAESERVRRQEALGIVPPGEQLHQHEIETVERMQSLGHQLRWNRRAAHATNDAVWIDMGGIEIEIKATKAKRSTIVDRIVECFRNAERAADRGDRADSKKNFIIDIGQSALSPLLAKQLSAFNASRSGQSPARRINRLWVMTRGQLVELPQVNE